VKQSGSKSQGQVPNSDYGQQQQGQQNVAPMRRQNAQRNKKPARNNNYDDYANDQAQNDAPDQVKKLRNKQEI
jgi:hypothetical protein